MKVKANDFINYISRGSIELESLGFSIQLTIVINTAIKRADEVINFLRVLIDCQTQLRWMYNSAITQ